MQCAENICLTDESFKTFFSDLFYVQIYCTDVSGPTQPRSDFCFTVQSSIFPLLWLPTAINKVTPACFCNEQ